jgi:hypothetical protein
LSQLFVWSGCRSAHLALEEYEDGETILQEAVRLKPIFPDAFCDLGTCLRLLKDPKGALQVLCL